MSKFRTEKIRDEETWEMVRRAWEGGETAASCARRFDVGLANLWRRRAAEGWDRERPADPAPVPPEGWDRYAWRKLEEFEERLAEERRLALAMLTLLEGGRPEEVRLWHVGFLYRFRAERMGPDAAAEDWALRKDEPWADAIWDEQGRLRSQGAMDAGLMRYAREDWRRWAGLPDGVMEALP